MADFVHDFIDRLIVGASFLVTIPIRISTSIAVFFYEIFEEIGNFIMEDPRKGKSFTAD